MIKRIIDISQQSYLYVALKQLHIDRKGQNIAKIPIEDIGVIILQHSAITLSQPLIVECQRNNTLIVFCDERHLPYSIILPIAEGHTLHSKILKEQVSVTDARRSRLWTQIVKEKIRQQAFTLELYHKSHKGLLHLESKVKSGDPENCEAQAAKQYWGLLMDKGFKRDVNASGVNALLNYGYAIMRAMVARAIVSTGLHPSLGLHHSNQYNPLCLADDVMEPFRAWVDFIVLKFLDENEIIEINQESKTYLLSLLSEQVEWGGRRYPLMTATHYYCARLKDSFTDNSIKLEFPQWYRVPN